MGDDCSNATLDKYGNRRLYRKLPPAQYIFEVQSLSSLLKTKVEKYETKVFEAGGYEWRMVLYPKGKKKGDGNANGKEKENENHQISLFLAITEPDDVSPGWDVNVIANFFVFDEILDRYLVVRDTDRIDWRFHKMKMKWGFDEFLSHDDLFKPSNGFVIDDRCIFGVEVFVIKSSGEGESLSFVKEPENGLYTWKIENFSHTEDAYYSEVFSVEGRNWKLKLHPKGDSGARHLSLYLTLDDSEALGTGQKLYARFLLRVKNHAKYNHYEKDGIEHWFETPGQGFMSPITPNDSSNVFLVNNCMTIEVKFDCVSVIKDFS